MLTMWICEFDGGTFVGENFVVAERTERVKDGMRSVKFCNER
jgi:hypothetical protein